MRYCALRENIEFITTLTIVVVSSVPALIAFIFQAIGLSTMMKKRGLKHAWVSFIPIVNFYGIGYLCDDINRYRKVQTKYRITILMWGSCFMVLMVLIQILYFGWPNRLGNMNGILTQGQRLGKEVFHYAWILYPTLIALIIWFVLYHIALYRIYHDYARNNDKVYLILSIAIKQIGISSYLLFSIRNHDSYSIYHCKHHKKIYKRKYPATI